MKKIISFVISGFLLYSSSFAQTVNLGEKHNQIVTYLDNYNFTGKTQDEFLDDVLYYTGSLIDPTVFSGQSKGIWGIIWACGKADPGGLDQPRTYNQIVDLLEQKGDISSQSNTFLKKLISETESDADYNSFVAKVNQLETNFNIEGLPELEKGIIQGGLSVFKESASFWNSYYSPDENTPEGRFSLRCFFCVAKNDLKGALLGFLIGNCICKKFGVVHPAICGAIGAAALGALYSWAAKVCPDICTKCKKPNPGSYPSWICNLPFLYWP